MAGAPSWRPAQIAPLFGLLGLLGCSRRSAPPSPSTISDSSTSIATAKRPYGDAGRPDLSPSTVTLLDAGRPPRRKLRYSWPRLRAEGITVDLRTHTESEDGAADAFFPPVRIAITIDPKRMTEDGTLHYDWRVTSAAVAQRDEPRPGTDEMQAELAAVRGLSGSAEVDTHGSATGIDVDPGSLPESGTPNPMVDQVRQILRDLAVPLPDEEVGVGARWEKRSEIEAEGVRVTQLDSFLLREMSRDEGSIDDHLVQTAPPGSTFAGEGDSGARATFQSMLASGDARSFFDLSRLAPRTHFSGRTTVVVAGPGGRDTAAFHAAIRIEMDIEGSLR